jgi:arylsulfatase A-like enzyme
MERDTLYWHYPHYHRTDPYGAIRERDMKLIEFFEDGSLELFDLANDPNETTNLASSRPEVAAELLKKLKAWRKSVGAQMMTENPNYKKGGKEPKRK